MSVAMWYVVLRVESALEVRYLIYCLIIMASEAESILPEVVHTRDVNCNVIARLLSDSYSRDRSARVAANEIRRISVNLIFNKDSRTRI